jgi:mRNA interferase MazF
VIVALDTGDDDFVSVPVTTQQRRDAFDMVIEAWQEAGLKKPSAARVHKMLTLPKIDIVQPLGRLHGDDLQRFLDLLCRAYCHRTQ